MQSAAIHSSIHEYWHSRAIARPNDSAATTDDIHLRRLEAHALVRELKSLNLKSGDRVLDVGCGDGRTTLAMAAAFPHINFLGVDFVKSMIDLALTHAQQPGLQSPAASFMVADVRHLCSHNVQPTFAAVTSVRCLINLSTDREQYQAMEQIAQQVEPGGYYIAIENFIEGHEAMNLARHAVGLPPIDVRWHNRFFSEPQFNEFAEDFFDSPRYVDFASSYYFATRVVYSKMCQLRNEQPDYDHDIHRLAVDIPPIGDLSPVRMAILRRK